MKSAAAARRPRAKALRSTTFQRIRPPAGASNARWRATVETGAPVTETTASTAPEILTRRDKGVLEIQFNRPGKRNAFTSEMYTTMAAALEAAEADPEVRVI